MRTFENRDEESAQRRSHPWSTSTGNVNHRYHDLRSNPELIRVALEDLRPWDAYPSVQSIYELLAWLNGPESRFESNDCAFTGPEDNADGSFDKRLRCTGRLGVLFRDLSLNTSDRAVDRWIEEIHGGLRAIEPDFAWGAVGTTRLRVDFRGLPEGHRNGWQLLLSFWAWGNDEAEVFENLARVIAALRAALHSSAD